jgi:hypothetical protein
MIRLDLAREPHWLDVGHGARLHVRPCNTALMMAARSEAQKAENVDHPARSVALVTALARFAILDWEGVGDGEGNPMPVSPEGVNALMDLWPVADAFERLYLGPALLLDHEKNA